MSQALQFRRLPSNPDLPLPARATPGSAGYDLRAAEAITLEPGQVGVVPTGLEVALPEGVEGQVRPRSGLAARHGITVLNTPGTIDPDYRGELRILLINLGPDPVSLQRGDRVAQLVLQRFETPSVMEVEALADTDRGDGGFGSTGKG
ncbi:MAG: dUTP diphosphatase [Gemmatimonadales bacterium]|nr:MAG: dUTP diphosphatase [Gemmatimonadales bacterium]